MRTPARWRHPQEAQHPTEVGAVHPAGDLGVVIVRHEHHRGEAAEHALCRLSPFFRAPARDLTNSPAKGT